MNNLIKVLKGGSGSGDWGHVGRAGKRGGSGGGGGKGKSRKGRRSREALDKEIESRKKPKPKQNISLSSATVDDETRRHRTQADPDREPRNNMLLLSAMAAADRSPEFHSKRVISLLSDKAGVDKADVDAYIRNWNIADDFGTKELIIRSINEEFGIELSSYEKSKSADSIDFNSNSDAIKNEVDANRKITRAMYDETQELLKNNDIDHVIAYRGLAESSELGNVGDVVNYGHNSAESWTLSEDMANIFARSSGDIIVKSKIPANRILSLATTGAGTSSELEIVVLGNNDSNDSVIISGKKS